MQHIIIMHTDMCAEPDNAHTVTVRIEDDEVTMRYFHQRNAASLTTIANLLI